MTAMNALIEDENITLSMDTLVSTMDENSRIVPSYFTQKFEYLPFAKSVIAGTGNFEVIKQAFEMSRRILACEVDTLSEIISDCFEQLDRDKYGITDTSTTTVYIFGFTDAGETRAYALRSTNNFQAEIVAGTGNNKLLIKPNLMSVEGFAEEIEKANDSDDLDQSLVDIMRAEKKYDDERDDKVGIGGENIRLVLGNDSNVAICGKIDTFDDYLDQYQFALDKMHEQL